MVAHSRINRDNLIYIREYFTHKNRQLNSENTVRMKKKRAKKTRLPCKKKKQLTEKSESFECKCVFMGEKSENSGRETNMERKETNSAHVFVILAWIVWICVSHCPKTKTVDTIQFNSDFISDWQLCVHPATC